MKVGGRLRCIGSPQHLKTRFGNHLELEVPNFFNLIVTCENICKRVLYFQVKPTEVNSEQLEALSLMIQEKLAEVPSHRRSLLGDLETCIGAVDITLDKVSVAEISLSRDLIVMIARWLGNEERVGALVHSSNASDGLLSEQLTDQLVRDGMGPFLHLCFLFLNSR